MNAFSGERYGLERKLRRELSYGTDCRNQSDGTNAVLCGRMARKWRYQSTRNALECYLKFEG